MINPVEKQLTEAVLLNGMKVRTNNATEMNPDTAKIAGLWQAFVQKGADKFNEQTHTYGVYTHYQSDHSGDYDIIACANNFQLDDDNSVDVELPAGNYLVFSAQGTMPTAVIDAWQAVWQYFSQTDCPHDRAYTTDFEHYTSNQAVDIYIAITG